MTKGVSAVTNDKTRAVQELRRSAASGTHPDRRTRRNRTRRDKKQRAIREQR